MNVQLPSRTVPPPLDTAVVNFRDLGRYKTATGIPLRPMMVFRSATLSHVNDDDVRSLQHLRIRTVIDLRTTDEQQFDGVAPEALGVTRHDIPLVGKLWIPGEPEDAAGFLAERYTEMFFDNTNRIVEAIETIVSEPGPVLFHCMAGKDRTGVIAASILDLLGVDDVTILNDYGASETEMPLLRALFESRFPEKPIPVPAALFDTAPQRAMSQAIDFVRCECGSIQQLLREAGLSLGTISALRLLLLQR
jgi:protein-tyrosine phosphatase